MLAVLGLLVCWVCVQAQEVAAAPPKVEFSEPQLLLESDTTREYLVRYPTANVGTYPENNTVTGYYMEPKSAGPHGCVIILHYWGATNLKIERSLAAKFNQRQMAALILTLPYHLDRTPAGSRSGQLAIQSDPEKLKEMMVQAVRDVRRGLDWCETRKEIDSNRIGLTGISLGSLVAEVVAGVDSRIHRAAFMLGGADFAGIIWNSSRAVRQREGLRRDGFVEESLRDALTDVEPLTYLANKQPQKSFVIGANYDTVIPRSSTDKLLNVLNNREKLWLDTGHYGGIFVQNKLLNEVVKFFDLELNGENYSAPRSIAAPTIRLSAQLSSIGGLEIGAGIDIVKPGRRNTPWLTFVLSPRAPELVLVQSLDRVFGLGIVMRPKKIGVGIFWSVVL